MEANRHLGRFILSIDQSTSGTKAILFNRKGEIAGRCTEEHRQFYPKPGWVEHDAEEIYEKLILAVQKVLDQSGATSEDLAAIAVTNQRETALVWDKTTGRPLYPAIVWQCQRSAALCQELADRGYEQMIRENTGLVLSPYFSAPKVKWILDNVEGAREKADAGQLLFGTMDSWILWKLTGGEVHATDYSNASRTMLFNILELKWDRELLALMGIPECMMPQVRFSNEIFGVTRKDSLFGREIPISGVMGDSHAALFGQNCFERGMAKCTFGTGSSIMMNIGPTPLISQNGIVTSLAWGMDGTVEYVLEGNINCTGATIKWLAEDLELIPDSKSAGEIAAAVSDNGGVYLVPAFVGLSAPYWDSEARASITGMSRGTKKSHIVRAAEESIAYQVRDITDLMLRESGISLKELRVDGGPTRDGFLMQFLADMLGVRVVRNRIEELSAIGSATMAGLATGFWSSREEISRLRMTDREFEGKMEKEKREALYAGWLDAVKRTLSDR